jgi:hypothetical protein
MEELYAKTLPKSANCLYRGPYSFVTVGNPEDFGSVLLETTFHC